MDYTVIGDAVNLAARLESATKEFGAELLISESTAQGIQRSHVLREVDLLRVKGKNEPVRVYEVVTHKLERCPHLSENFAEYDEGLISYRRGDWTRALGRFNNAAHKYSGDRLSEIYVKRCQYFLHKPPGPDWDGVWTMKTK